MRDGAGGYASHHLLQQFPALRDGAREVVLLGLLDRFDVG